MSSCKSILSIVVLLFVLGDAYAKSEKHPRIYYGNTSKEDFLKSANDVLWKPDLIQKKKANVEKDMAVSFLSHQEKEYVSSKA